MKEIARELQRFQQGLQKTARLGCKDAKSPLIRVLGEAKSKRSSIFSFDYGCGEGRGLPSANAIGVVRAAAGHCAHRATQDSASTRCCDSKQSHSTQMKRKAIAIMYLLCL